MKDSRIAADLAGYLTVVLPSTRSEVLHEGGRHGVRVWTTYDGSVSLFLAGAHWISSTGVVKIAVAETYPQVPIYATYMVAGASATLSHSVPLVPLDRTTDGHLTAWREYQSVRLGEAVTYLRQVLFDRRSSPKSIFQARKALDIVQDRLAELQDVSRNPGPGAPTPLPPSSRPADPA